MKNKLVGIGAIITMMMFGGCASSVPITTYNAPKSKVASSAITGNQLNVKYLIDNSDSSTNNYQEYFIFSGSSPKPLVATYSYKRKYTTADELFKIPTAKSLFIYGTIGDKVVFVFNNGVTGGSPLAVYDFSDKKTYFLTAGDEEYMFLKKGTSYVVKLLTQNKYIALNNLQEVKIDESKYTPLKVQFVTGNRWADPAPKTVMPTYVIGSFIGVREKKNKLPPFIFGPNAQRVSKSYGFDLRW